jgi:hypothetical protein
MKYQATSNNACLYTVLFLSPTSHQITVEKASFRPITRTGIQLQVAQSVNVDFRLELGAVTQSVSITDSAPLLDASSNVIGGVVASDKIENDPMKGRNSSAFMGNYGRTSANAQRLSALPPTSEEHSKCGRGGAAVG